jgi:hypothetical protein
MRRLPKLRRVGSFMRGPPVSRHARRATFWHSPTSSVICARPSGDESAPYLISTAHFAKLKSFANSAMLSGTFQRSRARAKCAAGRPSHWVSAITRGKPINGPPTKFRSMLSEKPSSSSATCFQVMPRRRRTTSKAVCNARVSKQRMRVGPGSGRASSTLGAVSRPERKFSGEHPSQRRT